MTRPEEIREWATFLSKIRRLQDSRGYIEVTTPHVVPAGAFETSLDCVKALWSGGEAELHTSPEIAMKKIIAETGLSIYQICACFRDDPESEIHRQEFRMLEFYRVGVGYRELLAETEQLIFELADGAIKFETICVEELFQKYVGQNVFEILKPGSDDESSDDFFRIWLEQIEPKLDPNVATFVIDYPAQLSTLLEVDEQRGIAKRFELYWKGMEICNGGEELRSSGELRKRYELTSLAREKVGKLPHPFPTLLEESMLVKQCLSGVAIGLERLFKALTGYSAFVPSLSRTVGQSTFNRAQRIRNGSRDRIPTITSS